MHTLTARWIFPVDHPPLPWGTITIVGETIVAVQERGRRTPDEDLGNVVVLPGLVNAHTHLDLSGMRGLCPPVADFAAWLRMVVRQRRQRSVEQTQQDILAGLAECQRYGTTLVGDIAAQGLSWPMLQTASLRSTIFHELLGLPADRADQALQQAESWLAGHADSPTCKAGLSPHAPYSVRSSLFANLADLLCRHEQMGRIVPAAIHLAESRQEIQLLEHHDGPLADFLRDMGVWDPDGLAASPAQIVQLFHRTPRTLFVHGNYLSPAEVGTGAVVYCPRTHLAFGHEPHPVLRFLEAGTCVALGTDSLASNPDLDVLAEARLLRRLHPGLPGATLLRMLTINGATVLGWQDVTGSLKPGKSADLAVLPASDTWADPHVGIFASTEPVQRVMWRGTWLPAERL